MNSSDSFNQLKDGYGSQHDDKGHEGNMKACFSMSEQQEYECSDDDDIHRKKLTDKQIFFLLPYSIDG